MFQQSNRVKNSGGYLQSSSTGTSALGHHDDGAHVGTPTHPSPAVGLTKAGKVGSNSFPSPVIRSHGCDLCNHAAAAAAVTTSKTIDHAATAAVSLKKHSHHFFQSEVNYTIAVTDWLYGGGDNYGQYLTNAVLLGTSEFAVRKIVTMFLVNNGHRDGCFTATMKALHPTTSSSSPSVLSKSNHTSAAASNGLTPPAHSHSTEW